MILDLTREQISDLHEALMYAHHSAGRPVTVIPERRVQWQALIDQLRLMLDDPDPAPAFVIKAQDLLGLVGIMAYRAECYRHQLGDQQQEVSLALVEMAGWQARHPARMKLPDHPHRPVTA